MYYDHSNKGNKMFKLVFFVPINEKEIVKNAIFSTGAGSLGNYSHCSFETIGKGQFIPLDGSNPAIGEHNEVEIVEEARIEILCSKENLKSAITAMIDAHPYEEVAYEVYELFNLDKL